MARGGGGGGGGGGGFGGGVGVLGGGGGGFVISVLWKECDVLADFPEQKLNFFEV